MLNLTLLLARLDEELTNKATETAIASVRSPGTTGDLFQYGKACGHYAGLIEARDLLRAIIQEETYDRDDNERTRAPEFE